MYVHTYISTEGSNHLVVMIFSLQVTRPNALQLVLSDVPYSTTMWGFLKSLCLHLYLLRLVRGIKIMKGEGGFQQPKYILVNRDNVCNPKTSRWGQFKLPK